MLGKHARCRNRLRDLRQFLQLFCPGLDKTRQKFFRHSLWGIVLSQSLIVARWLRYIPDHCRRRFSRHKRLLNQLKSSDWSCAEVLKQYQRTWGKHIEPDTPLIVDLTDLARPRARKRAPVADRQAREFLRKADPVLARLIDARPDFRPRAWMDELPPLDAFGTLIFQVAGQQLSVGATRTILSRVEGHFGGHLPSPAELLAADPHVLRDSGMSTRKGETLRALAERFVDGRLSDGAFSQMTDSEVEAALTEVSGIGPWTARGFLLVGLDRPDVFLSGDLALRRTVQRVYGFDHPPTDEEIAELSDRWRPYRSLAVSYLFASGYDV